MDKTFIRDLKVHAIIGVYDFERKHEQPLSFDIEMQSDLTQAGQSDDLVHAINYAAVSQDVIELTQTLKPLLIERLAEAVAEMILTRYQPDSVTVRISKPDAVPAASAVGVEITRAKSDKRG